jgi:putative Holliday junction resolvase
VQEKETINSPNFSDLTNVPSTGRILGIDLGSKRVGIAVCDELQIAVRKLTVLERRSWKELLKKIIAIIEEFDAKAIVIGLPLNMDGSPTDFSDEVFRISRNLSLSVKIPVYCQDERLSSKFARQALHEDGLSYSEIKEHLDSEAAAVILADFLARKRSVN